MIRLGLALILFALCPAFFLSSVALAKEGAEKPNILYILADDLGYGDVQCLNPQRGKIATPHLDKLASQGMTFTNAHSGSSVCTPTRYGLLTGRYAWRTRLQAGVLDGGNDEPLIAADRLTVAGLLKAQGYTTACIGKWHLGFQSKSQAAKGDKKKGMGNAGLPIGAEIIGGPVTRGFDLFWGCSNARTMSALIEGDRVIETIEPVTMLPRLGNRAVRYVQERAAEAKAGNPFFLYLPLTSPHTPILPTPEWQGKSGLGDYGDFVMMTDAIVGDVLTALDQAGLADNTLVIFTADNGCSPQAGTERLEKQGHFASERLRGYKADIWDGGHRVPFFVRWPGKVKAGTKTDQLICHTDFMATCAEILGVKLPDTAAEDSMSLLPALLGTENAVSRQNVVHHSISGRFAVREGPWKLCLCPGSGGWGKPGDAEAAKQGLPSVQLYDLSTDIAETKNLSAEHPDIVAKLTRQLETSIAYGRNTPGAKQANDVEIDILKTKKGRAVKE
ncbi:MAG TPA: arylsulfatase [Verrucomicrobiales bacterium]|nr:arylsulfatase [Verrucomicrobiales bacterium]